MAEITATIIGTSIYAEGAWVINRNFYNFDLLTRDRISVHITKTVPGLINLQFGVDGNWTHGVQARVPSGIWGGSVRLKIDWVGLVPYRVAINEQLVLSKDPNETHYPDYP